MLPRLCLLLLSVGVLVLVVITVNGDGADYTDQFVVQVEGGEEVAELVARSRGFKLERKVRYVEQQRLLRREKRHPMPDVEATSSEVVKRTALVSRSNDSVHVLEPRMKFNDPLYQHQWYLENRGQNGGHVGNDMNVVGAWERGFTGEGVNVCVLDDGLQYEHADLRRNYLAEASGNFNDHPGVQGDPAPDTSVPDNNHGTECSGEISAEANNGVCGVGVAFNSRISGIRILDGDVTDSLEAEALIFRNQDIDIYSVSWGPPDDGEHMDGPRKTCSDALQQGAQKGRGGLGSVFVWATGNGASRNDTCAADGYVGSIYTISIGSITEEGLSSYFSEVCPSTMAVTYTGGSHHMGDLNSPDYAVVTTNVDQQCNTHFQGTSAAAPLAAGCFALVLQANALLTWRDLQYLVVNTARVPHLDEKDWQINAAGHHLNAHLGFGVLDCAKMVENAQNWITVPEQRNCSAHLEQQSNMVVGPTPGGRQDPTCVNFTIPLSPCHGDGEEIRQMEHTTLNIAINASRRGDIGMDLYSPMGTKSRMLEYRYKDAAQDIEFEFGGFMTVFNWGEMPFGDWVLTVCNAGNSSVIEVNEVTLTVFGVSTSTQPGSSDKRTQQPSWTVPHRASKRELESIMAEEKTRSLHIRSAPAMADELEGHEGREEDKPDGMAVELVEKLLY